MGKNPKNEGNKKIEGENKQYKMKKEIKEKKLTLIKCPNENCGNAYYIPETEKKKNRQCPYCSEYGYPILSSGVNFNKPEIT